MSIPKNETGGVVTVEPAVFRSAQCAVQLQTVRVFSTGLQLQLTVLMRRAVSGGPDTSPVQRDRVLLGMGRFGDDMLWVGVELVDGRTATAGLLPPGVDLPAETSTLARIGGSSSGNTASFEYFLAPLPPPGPVKLVLAWPAFSVEESTTVIPADQVAAAVARIMTLWPEEADDERFTPRRPPQPPPGGWFQQHPPPS